MRCCNQGRFRQQVSFLRGQFLQDGGLPFSDVLSKKIVKQALTAISVRWFDRHPRGTVSGPFESPDLRATGKGLARVPCSFQTECAQVNVFGRVGEFDVEMIFVHLDFTTFPAGIREAELFVCGGF
jgi:hypothetical protein